MRTFNYFNYLPQRFTTDNESVLNVRRFIYAFKNGNRQATDYAIDLVSKTFSKWYGVSCQDYVLVCAVSYQRQVCETLQEVCSRGDKAHRHHERNKARQHLWAS